MEAFSCSLYLLKTREAVVGQKSIIERIKQGGIFLFTWLLTCRNCWEMSWSLHPWMLWAVDLISSQQGFVWTAWTMGRCNCWCVGIWAEALLTRLKWLLLIANRNAALNENAKRCELSGLKTTSCLWEQRRHFNQKNAYSYDAITQPWGVYLS